LAAKGREDVRSIAAEDGAVERPLVAAPSGKGERSRADPFNAV